jgi:hypothetical protein
MQFENLKNSQPGPRFFKLEIANRSLIAGIVQRIYNSSLGWSFRFSAIERVVLDALIWIRIS